MAELTFYHQVRVNGGERTGIDGESGPLLHYFQEGTEEFDPSLLWYVDVRCSGDQLPRDPQAAREWFLKNASFFVEHLKQVADAHLGPGFDADYLPYQQEIQDAPDGARVRIVVSAARRLVARNVASELRDVAGRWTQLLDRLVPLSLV